MASSTPQTTTRPGPSWISEPPAVGGFGLPGKGRALGGNGTGRERCIVRDTMAPAFLAHLASYRVLFMLRIQVHRAKDLFSSRMYEGGPGRMSE
jgi:hypothetical protein